LLDDGRIRIRIREVQKHLEPNPDPQHWNVYNVLGSRKAISVRYTELTVRVVYSRRGKYIFSGNSKGKILIVDSASLEVKSSFKVTQTAAANNAVKVSKNNVYLWLAY
jgi:hypothetical protein